MNTQRVDYIERQVLSAADLNDEQLYRLRVNRQHNLGPHGWGILFGLSLAVVNGDLFLNPGAAVDGYGRELYVPSTIQIPEALVDGLKYDPTSGLERQIDLWLRYYLAPVTTPQTGLYPCGPGQYNRLNEETRLSITLVSYDPQTGRPLPVNPRQPSGVPSADLLYAPYQDPPDDPLKCWPVYLGRVKWPVATTAQPESLPHVLRKARRPYAGLAGTALRSASRQAAPDNPDNPSPQPAPPLDRARLHISDGQSGQAAFSIQLPNTAGQMIDQVAVAQNGQVTLNGQTSLLSEYTTQELAAGSPLSRKDTRHISDLRLGQNQLGFTALEITDPRCLAKKILDGRLPIQSIYQEYASSQIQSILTQNPDNLLVGLADLLNYLIAKAKTHTILDNQRLAQTALGQDTWQWIHNWPLEDHDYRPLVWQVFTDVLSGELIPGLSVAGRLAIEFGPLAAESKTALPWQAYRVDSQDENGEVSSQLRFEIEDPGDQDDPARYQFEIGKYSEVSAQKSSPSDDPQVDFFEPCLIVDAACNVIIKGILVVEGDLLQGPIPTDPSDPRFINSLLQSWSQGNAAAQTASSLTAAITDLKVDPTAKNFSYNLGLTNSGQYPITDLQVDHAYAITSLPNGSGPVETPGRIEAGSTLSVPVPQNLPSAPATSGQISLTVAVRGIGFGNVAVLTTASQGPKAYETSGG